MERRHIAMFLTALIGTVGIFGVLHAASAPVSPAPSVIVLIGLESTRADHVGPCYGYDRVTAPNVCGIADDGVLFEQAYAQGTWTPMSVPAFLTARTPREVGTWWLDNVTFSENLTTFPEVLDRHGYRTTATSVDLFQESGLLQGFDATDRGNEPIRIGQERGEFLFTYFREIKGPRMPAEEYRLWDNLSRDRQTWDAEDLPRQTTIDVYDEMILQADQGRIDQLVARLKEKELYENAMIVVWADHGQVFGEHGVTWSHGGTPYEEIIHVPLIVKFPGNRFAGLRVSEPVSLVDVPHTIFDYMGIREGFGSVGSSLLPVVGEAVAGFDRFDVRGGGEDRVVFSARTPNRAWMVRRGNYTYLLDTVHRVCVEGERPDVEVGGEHAPWDPWPEELYDLSRDPGQENDIAEDRQDVVLQLRADLCKVYNVAGRDPQVFEEGRLSEQQREQLKELGPPYAQQGTG